jgi:hypothetical protein
MLDTAPVLPTIFTIVDDTMKGSPMIQQTLDRPGPAPRLCASEVVTLAIYQELIGEPREDHFFRRHPASLLTFFPGLNERSRYNRRKRDRWAVILAVRVSLQMVLDALQLEETAAVDSAPVPCVGYPRAQDASDFVGTADSGVCSSKAMKYFGLKLHSVVSFTGVGRGFLLTRASRYDNQSVVELLDLFSHHLPRLLGDGAYHAAALQSFLEQYRSVELLAPTKVNQQPIRSQQAHPQLNRLRLIGETVNAQLQEQLHLSKHYAKSSWGLMTSMAAQVTAHRVGMMVNKLLGRSLVRMADLAV